MTSTFSSIRSKFGRVVTSKHECLAPRPLAVGSRLAFVAKFLGRRLAYTYEIVELAAGEKLVMRTSDGPAPVMVISCHSHPDLPRLG